MSTPAVSPAKYDLTRADRLALQAASTTAADGALGGLVAELAAGRWLPVGNPYLHSVVHRLRPGGPLWAAGALREYVAASVVVHLADGWSYLARSLEACVGGDYAASLHLAYYAELRAAIALLARSSVGVFDYRHVVFDSSATARPIDFLGTHFFAWKALYEWASTGQARDLLEDSLEVETISFREWLRSFNPGAPFAATAADWMRAWGIDLKTFATDRQQRNHVSYRPTSLDRVESRPPAEVYGLLRAIWEAVEPRPAPFDRTNRHLLRLAIEAAGRPFGRTWLEQRWQAAVDAQNVSPSGKQRLVDFVLRRIEPDDLDLLRRAQSPDVTHAAVCARAALLLRLASGAAHDLLKRAGVAGKDLRFWWEPWGAERGFWASGDPPDDLSLLWDDVSDAMNHLEDWILAQLDPARRDWAGGWAPEHRSLCGTERVLLWGIRA